MPSESASAGSSCSGSASTARETNAAPSANSGSSRSATRKATRVLPTPPGPVNVTRRTSGFRSRSTTKSMCHSGPTTSVSSFGSGRTRANRDPGMAAISVAELRWLLVQSKTVPWCPGVMRMSLSSWRVSFSPVVLESVQPDVLRNVVIPRTVSAGTAALQPHEPVGWHRFLPGRRWYVPVSAPGDIPWATGGAG
jgi:hypothetical protein